MKKLTNQSFRVIDQRLMLRYDLSFSLNTRHIVLEQVLHRELPVRDGAELREPLRQVLVALQGDQLLLVGLG